jgi:transposase InsO family protein
VRHRRRRNAVDEHNAALVQRITELKSLHPFWGYRRIWAHLRYIDGQDVNHKRVYRLLKEHDLLVTPNARLRAKRTSSRAKPRPTRPNEWWGIDMTKVLVQDFGWLYIVFVVDWYTKKVVGHYVEMQCRAKHWFAALNDAANRQFPDGINGAGVSLMSDNGCQPTSTWFMRNCAAMGVRQAFTSYNNPKGNADTERMFRTLKEELIWLKDWYSPQELERELNSWVEGYNNSYLHSTLGYRPPNVAEASYYADQMSTICVA